jgi:hypothetical protein
MRGVLPWLLACGLNFLLSCFGLCLPEPFKVFVLKPFVESEYRNAHVILKVFYGVYSLAVNFKFRAYACGILFLGYV